MADSKGLAGKGTLGCGALLLLMCTAGCLFFGFHVFLDPGGKISDDEALPGMLGAISCGFVSFLLAAVGAFLTFRKSPEPAGASAATPAPGAGSAPGVASAPGAAPAAPKPKKPFPTHFVAGCLSLFVLLGSCLGFGGGAYFYDRAESAERLERWALEDQRQGRSYGLGPSFWRRQAEEREQFMMGSLCCGGFMLLLFFGGIAGAVVLFRKNQAKAAEMAAEAAGELGGPTVPDQAQQAGGFTPPPPSG